jgi:hypothetical protein
LYGSRLFIWLPSIESNQSLTFFSEQAAVNVSIEGGDITLSTTKDNTIIRGQLIKTTQDYNSALLRDVLEYSAST